MKNIEILIPDNCPDDWISFYNRKQHISLPEQKIHTYHNCFLSHEGIPLKNLKIPRLSLVNLKGKEDTQFYKEFRKLAVEQYLVSTYGKSLKLQKVDKDLAFCYGKWFNYFFWITEYLPKMIRLRNEGYSSPIIFPQSWEKISFVSNALSLLGENNLFVVENGVHLKVRDLVIPSSRPYSNVFYKENIGLVRTAFIKDSNEPLTKRRIYATRRTALRRSLINEPELIFLLEKYNYEVVDFSELSFTEQIDLMKNSESLISVHGAGLANMIWMPSGSAVIELNYKIENTDPRISYWRLSRACDHRYYISFGEAGQNKGESIHDYDMRVDLSSIEKYLQKEHDR